MELPVGAEERVDVAARPLHRLGQLRQAAEGRAVEAGQGRAQQQRLKALPDLVQLGALRQGQPRHPGAGVRDEGDQALGLQHPQRLAHRDAARPGPRGDVLLPDPLARPVAAVQDRGAQRVRDPLASVFSAPVLGSRSAALCRR